MSVVFPLKDRIGRESTMFASALAVSALTNYFVRKGIATPMTIGGQLSDDELFDAQEKCFNMARNMAGSRSEKQKAIQQCIERKRIGKTTYDTSIKNAIMHNLLSIVSVGGPMTGLYYLWDAETVASGKPQNTRLAMAITYGILCTLLQIIISSAGRPESHFEVWLYSTTFAISATGLSALMHEYY